MKSLKIFPSTPDIDVQKMFMAKGHEITMNMTKADVVVFMGGADVCPFLYGEKPIKKTTFSLERDLQDIRVFKEIKRTTPKVGICRGSQFLNVMCGGRLWQHVDRHCLSHVATDRESNEEYLVTSTHHQMMRPASHANVLMTASLSSSREAQRQLFTQQNPGGSFDDDIEVVWYEDERALCFQPHPEYGTEGNQCREYFWKVFDKYVVPLIP